MSINNMAAKFIYYFSSIFFYTPILKKLRKSKQIITIFIREESKVSHSHINVVPARRG